MFFLGFSRLFAKAESTSEESQGADGERENSEFVRGEFSLARSRGLNFQGESRLSRVKLSFHRLKGGMSF
jgi:hypothetical protein